MEYRDPTCDTPLCLRGQRGHQTGLQKIQPEGDLQIRQVPPVHNGQIQGCTSSGEAIQGHVPNPLQLWEDLHWRDNQEAQGKDEGTPRCALQRNDGVVSSGRACPGAPPLHWVGTEGTWVIDQARRPKELQLKEALRIQMSDGELLNWDTGLEVPGCWLATLKRRHDQTNHSQARFSARHPVTSDTI